MMNFQIVLEYALAPVVVAYEHAFEMHHTRRVAVQVEQVMSVYDKTCLVLPDLCCTSWTVDEYDDEPMMMQKTAVAARMMVAQTVMMHICYFSVMMKLVLHNSNGVGIRVEVG